MLVIFPGGEFSELILNCNLKLFLRRKYSCNKKFPYFFFSLVSRPLAQALDFGRSSRHAGAPGDGLVVVLFEFLDDDTKLAQSCTAGNRPWSWECPSPAERWMLGYAHLGQPTVIFRVFSHAKKWMLGYAHLGQPTVILRRKRWMLGYVHFQQPIVILPMSFLIKTVTLVTPVTSVIFLPPYCFRFVMPVIWYKLLVFDFNSCL